MSNNNTTTIKTILQTQNWQNVGARRTKRIIRVWLYYPSATNTRARVSDRASRSSSPPWRRRRTGNKQTKARRLFFLVRDGRARRGLHLVVLWLSSFSLSNHCLKKTTTIDRDHINNMANEKNKHIIIIIYT